MLTKIIFAARSDTGKVRSSNEDNLYCNGVIMTASAVNGAFSRTGVTQTPAIFAICDGMGGEDCGELASLTAVEELAAHSRSILDNPNDENLEVNEYVQATHRKLQNIMKQQHIRTGTTLALVVAGSSGFTIYNLGDSRIYRTNETGRLLRVTDDHTLAEEKMRMGYITAAQADKSRERHILMRYLGMVGDELGAMPDVSGTYGYGANTRVLLSSDGLNDMLAFREISGIVTSGRDASDTVNALVEAALLNGGVDNVTCIVLDFVSQ